MKETETSVLAQRLREAREYLGLSQERVAAALKIPRPAISLIESGTRRVSAIELAAFAKLYQRPQSFFTGEKPVRATPPQMEVLKRTTAALSDKDRDEVLRFAQFLRDRARRGE